MFLSTECFYLLLSMIFPNSFPRYFCRKLIDHCELQTQAIQTIQCSSAQLTLRKYSKEHESKLKLQELGKLDNYTYTKVSSSEYLIKQTITIWESIFIIQQHIFFGQLCECDSSGGIRRNFRFLRKSEDKYIQQMPEEQDSSKSFRSLSLAREKKCMLFVILVLIPPPCTSKFLCCFLTNPRASVTSKRTLSSHKI